MSKPRKDAPTKSQLSNMLTKLEAGKSQIKVGDMRQAMSLLVLLEAAFINAGYKSSLLPLRKLAVLEAAKAKAKEAKLKAKAAKSKK